MQFYRYLMIKNLKLLIMREYGLIIKDYNLSYFYEKLLL